MNPSRRGKIARLPRPIREALNQRLNNGEIGAALLVWLNALPEVRAVLAAHFGGEPISDRNLSRWKQGGFVDWRQHVEAQEWVGRLMEEGDEIEGEPGARKLADRLSAPVVVELFKLLKRAAASDDPVEHRKAVLGAAQQLAQLRRADHRLVEMSLLTERLAVNGARSQTGERETAE